MASWAGNILCCFCLCEWWWAIKKMGEKKKKKVMCRTQGLTCLQRETWYNPCMRPMYSHNKSIGVYRDVPLYSVGFWTNPLNMVPIRIRKIHKYWSHFHILVLKFSGLKSVIWVPFSAKITPKGGFGFYGISHTLLSKPIPSHPGQDFYQENNIQIFPANEGNDAN